MGFDLIEGLREEEILNLYENDLLEGIEDGAYKGNCICNTSIGAKIFGYASHTSTYCGLMLSTPAS